LHLQIQEGKLIPYGQIDQASVRWKPVDNFKITDYGVARNRDYFEMDSTNNRMTLNEPTAYGLNFHVVTGELYNGFTHVSANLITINGRKGSTNNLLLVSGVFHRLLHMITPHYFD